MGRLLAIAEKSEKAIPPRGSSGSLPTNGQDCLPAVDPALAAILDTLTRSALPLLHSRIIKEMALRGHSKEAAKEAITTCQQRGWIGHNGVTGYDLGTEKKGEL